jgi:cell division initiation protein
MEVTPKTFREVQFREKLRGGYHPEDVDEFLEQAAVGVEALLAQLREAEERVARAERAAAEASTDDTLKRVLVIAQRAADQAVQEAREEAERLLEEAKSKAGAVLADAEERAQRAYERGLAESRANLEKAEEALRHTQHEAEVLREWVDKQREQLLRALDEARDSVQRASLSGEPPLSARRDGPPMAGAQPMAHETVAAEPSAASAGAPEVVGAESPGPDPGEWDRSYVAGLGPEPSAAGQAGRPGDSSEGVQGGPPRPGELPGEGTIAFDEEALESFFSEQDLGEERGLGRFRRRQ